MIDFTCTCKHPFRVSDDQAGGLIQCPQCGRLNDIPTLSDLQSIETDGTYKIEEAPTAPDPHRLAELQRVWAKTKVDEFGNEIDLRNTEIDYDRIGDGAETIELKDEIVPPAPKYDPDTGKLVRPMKVQKDDAPGPADIPMATPVISYASRETARGTSFFRPMIDLFSPGNLVVIFFVAVMHILWQVMTGIVLFGFMLIIIAWLLLPMMIIAHYGNTVDEYGPENHDELPRPLRNLSWHEDLWGPFANIVGAFFLAYIPAAIVREIALPHSIHTGMNIAALIFGTFVFPALMLTTTTSGTVVNLRPDRVLGVIRACGRWYALAVAYWIATMVAYVFGLAAIWIFFFSLFAPTGANLMREWLMLGGFLALCAAIYVAHLYCIHLGLLYRAFQPNFPWVMQSHRREPPRPRLSGEERRAAQIERQMREQRRARARERNA